MNKYLIFGLLAMILVACGVDNTITFDNPESCSVVDNLLTCPDGSTFDLATLQGEQGPPGPQGQPGPIGPQGLPGPQGEQGSAADPALIVDLIDPCGPTSGPDEVLFILSTGQFAAWYKDVGLVVLEDGTYRTTDSQQCRFRISDSGTTLTEL